MLELKNISYIVDGTKIIDDISLVLEDNLFYVITGANGSGKSTFAKLIMGIEQPTSGRILWNGKDITTLPINERADLGISLAFQQPVKYKGITVLDLLKFSAGKALSHKDACDALSAVGLCTKDYVDREINSTLSGGELKRIELASVILRKSKLTILDEPEAGIDIWSFSKLTDLFSSLKKENNGTVLIISHQERILKIADKIIIMDDGKVRVLENSATTLKDLGIAPSSDSACRCKGGSCNG